jgi:hypothetical protein
MNYSEHNEDHRELTLLRREQADAEAALAEAEADLGRIRWAIAEIEEQGPTPDAAAWMMFGRAAETVEMNAWFQAPAAGEGGDHR